MIGFMVLNPTIPRSVLLTLSGSQPEKVVDWAMRTMNRTIIIIRWIAKAALVCITFFGCFATTIPAVVLMTRMFPNASFFIHVLPVIPIMVAANRFILSPIEFHLNFKSMQYDPWYERRKTKTGAQQANPAYRR